MVIINIYDQEATINDLEWTSKDKRVLNILKFETEWFFKLNDITPSMGDPDYVIAKHVTDRMKGKILKHEYTEFDPKVIY